MRSLGTVRTRVERLAAVGLPGSEPMIISWKFRHGRCPSLRHRCGGPRQGAARMFLLGRRPDDVSALRGDAAVVMSPTPPPRVTRRDAR